MALKIKTGMALVLAGPQGSGRMQAAIEAAKPLGSYRTCSIDSLFKPFGLASALRDKPRTLIVDAEYGAIHPGIVAKLKCLISNKTVMVEDKRRRAHEVPTPNMIFITGAANPLSLDGNDRRFMVVNMPMQKVA